jgi:copper transport protein
MPGVGILQPIRRPAHLRRLLISATIIAIAPQAAYAHAHLVKSAPAANSHVLAPTALRLWFSEAAEAAMTTIAVTDASGEKVSLGAVSADKGNAMLLSAPFRQTLAAGTYTVNWRTVARDDGHPSHGSFSFIVDAASSVDAADSAGIVSAGMNGPASGASASQAAGPPPPAAEGSAASVQSAGYVAARWLNFMSLLLVIGAVGFRLLVIPRVADAAQAATTPRSPVTDSDRFDALAVRRTATLGAIGALAVAVACIWRLFEERATIGAGIGISTVLTSYWGRVLQVEAAAAIVAFMALILGRRSASAGGSGWWWLAAIAALVLSAVSAFSGHAIASPHYRNMSVLVDVVHVLAAGTWLGGLAALLVVGVPVSLGIEKRRAGEGESATLLARIVNAFSPMALGCASLVVLSGVVAAWMRLGSLSALVGSAYGKVLLVKIACVVAVIAGGAFNWRRTRSAIAARGSAAVGALRRGAWFELGAAIVVLGVTAVLVATQPPIH